VVLCVGVIVTIRNMASSSLRRLAVCLVVVVVLLSFSLLTSSSRLEIPPQHRIDVPYHSQLTDYSCGVASMQMLLEYYGTKVIQSSIADVLRTSENQGTLSLDMVRGAHFSPMSSSIGIAFPNSSLINGYPGTSFGFGSFWKDSKEEWLDELKTLIAQDIPVGVEMNFSPNDTVNSDGHFRVVIGYDDITQEITMNDPWNWDGNPEVAVWPYSEFLYCWNYIEPESPRVNPYFGVVVVPWNVTVAAQAIASDLVDVVASIEYVCPSPFDCTMFPVTDVSASIRLNFTDNLWLDPSSALSYPLGGMSAGQTLNAKWTVQCDGPCAGKGIAVRGTGIVMNTEVAAICCNSTVSIEAIWYPQYTYFDTIGGESSFILP